MLSRAWPAAVHGIDAYAIEVEVNAGSGAKFIAMGESIRSKPSLAQSKARVAN